MLHGYDDQDRQGGDVGEHLEELLRAAGQAVDVEIHPGEQAEEVRPPDRAQRTPGGEDHQRHGQPAEAFNAAGAVPGALLIIHHVIQTAQTGDHGADAGGQIFVFRHVDADRVSRGGVFTNRAQVQPGHGLVQEEAHQHGENDRDISQKAVGEEKLSDNAQLRKEGQLRPESLGGHQNVDLPDTAGQFVQGTAEEVGETGGEDVESQTHDVLIAAQRDRHEGEKQPGKERSDQAADHRDQDTDDRVCRAAHGTFIIEGADQAGDAAHVHDPGYAKVEVPAFFRQNLTDRPEEDHGAKHDSGIQQCDKLCHFVTSDL